MLTLIIFLWFRFTLGDVSLGFPFNEQLPNIARINQPYVFTMSNSTYESSNEGEPINYSVANLPDWLSFDQNSRTFTGTPSESDVGEFSINLTGTDSVNSLTQSYKMLVSNDTGLELTSSNVIFVEISQYGQTNGVDGLVVKEGEQIYIKFDTKVFQPEPDSDRPIIAYYGRSADRTSLPNWISFDSDDLSFSGTVPHVISTNAPSFEYGFSFIGSDYYGYAGAEGLFKIVVGGHQLSTDVNETIKVNGTLGDSFDISVPVLSTVYLDGELISQHNISGVEANDLPDYVEFNQGNYTLTGSFPKDSAFDNFTVSIYDIYGNAVELPYSFDAIGSVFTVKSLPSVNATKGEFFKYELLDSYFTNVNETKVSANFSNADWLTYISDNKTFTGNVPDDFDSAQIGIDASSPYDDESKSFQIKGVDFVKSSSSSSSSASSSSSESSSSSSSSTASASASAGGATTSKKSNSALRKKLAIGLGVGIPALLILIAAVLLLCCCVRRRRKHDEEKDDKAEGEKSSDTTLEEAEINGPGFGIINGKPKTLAAANVDKLDKDNQSTSSTITHVEESDNGSNYFDADESQDKPMKSWRANDHSDIAKTTGAGLNKSGNYRKSDVSLSTVATDQLFSVRLVEDNSIIRNSNQSSFGSGQFLSNNSLNALLNREDSGNFQRLDSDGNIVEGAVVGGAAGAEGTRSPRRPMGRVSSTNLGVLAEHSNENSRDYSGSISNKSKQSLYDDFRAAQNEDGTYDWVDSNDENTYKYLNNGKTIDMSLSDNSIYKDPENPARISSSSLGKKAKLVEFTRKSSLRESAHQLNYTYEGEQVSIHDDDSI